MRLTVFLETIRETDNNRKYYIGGCRVKKQVFNSVGDGKRENTKTIIKNGKIYNYHERSL